MLTLSNFATTMSTSSHYQR